MSHKNKHLKTFGAAKSNLKRALANHFLSVIIETSGIFLLPVQSALNCIQGADNGSGCS